jgi:hypothetical protein
MNIYIFKSETKSELRAFAGDVQGSKLPDKFRPWRAVGVVSDGKALPFRRGGWREFLKASDAAARRERPQA